MISAAVSAIALFMAVGPQLQLSLQVAIEDTQTDADSIISDQATLPASEPAATVIRAVEEQDTQSDDAAIAVLPIDESTSDARDVGEPETPAEVETAPAAVQDDTPAPVQSSAVAESDWPAVLDAVSTSLSEARTAKGNFIQTNADGSVTTGTFALSRPGRMRFDYDDPTPILIVSNGTTVGMEDSELETVDRVPIGATPLNLILATDLNVDEDVEVLSVMRNEDRVGVRVSDASGELEGTLTMVFDAAGYELLGWLAIDGNLQTTVVDLMDVETNTRIDPRLFRLDDAEDDEDER